MSQGGAPGLDGDLSSLGIDLCYTQTIVRHQRESRVASWGC